MEDAIKTIEYKEHIINILPDDNTESPREWDNLGEMVCWHSRYNLGNKHDYDEPSDFEATIKKNDIVLSLSLYDHSGLRIKKGSFYGLLPQGHAEFDTMRVGYIIARADVIRKEYNVKRITKAIIEKVKKVLENEVKTYDTYLGGSVVGFTISKENDDDYQGESIWGFYDIDDAITDAKGLIDYEVEQEQKKHEVQTKAYIQNRVQLEYRHA